MMTAMISDPGLSVSWHDGAVRSWVKDHGWHMYVGRYDKASDTYYATSVQTLSTLLSNVRFKGFKHRGDGALIRYGVDGQDKVKEVYMLLVRDSSDDDGYNFPY
jgi:hypothetical protein